MNMDSLIIVWMNTKIKISRATARMLLHYFLLEHYLLGMSATNTSKRILHQNRRFCMCNTVKAMVGIISTPAKVRTKVLAGVMRTDCRSQLKPAFLWSNSSLASFFWTGVNFRLSYFDRQISIMSAQESFWDHFWLAKLFFQAAGIIPIGGTNALWKSVLSELLASSPLFYSFYILIPEMNYILFRANDIDNLLEAILIVISTLSGQIRSIFVRIYRHKIAELFNICVKLWERTDAKDHEVISIWADRARLISTIYFCAAQCPVTMFILTSTVKQLSSPENSTLRYYPFWPEGDSTPSPFYQIKYILLVASGYLGISFVAACDMTGTLLALNMCGQLALIQSWLEEMSKNKVNSVSGDIDEDFKIQLRKCAEHHQVVMNFCVKLEETVKYNYLIQIVTEMYGMAVSGAGLQTSLGSYRFVGSLSLAICGLFFSCWPADNLSFASNEIAIAVYQVPWHLCSPREKTAIAIMLMRSQRNAQLSAGNFIPLSLETFSSIVSSGMSFCLVLRSF